MNEEESVRKFDAQRENNINNEQQNTQPRQVKDNNNISQHNSDLE